VQHVGGAELVDADEMHGYSLGQFLKGHYGTYCLRRSREIQ
jgi:hypothetical protein